LIDGFVNTAVATMDTTSASLFNSGELPPSLNCLLPGSLTKYRDPPRDCDGGGSSSLEPEDRGDGGDNGVYSGGGRDEGESRYYPVRFVRKTVIAAAMFATPDIYNLDLYLEATRVEPRTEMNIETSGCLILASLLDSDSNLSTRPSPCKSGTVRKERDDHARGRKLQQVHCIFPKHDVRGNSIRSDLAKARGTGNRRSTPSLSTRARGVAGG
ncbi:hypothetical protein BDK51DRAFT_37633, partial [Blyttiomyces helicus]